MAIESKNRTLYTGVFAALLFLFVAAVGPGLFSSGEMSYNSWQYQIFEALCHQDPDRSFVFSNTQMAVCSRCIGIYGFLMISWAALPLYSMVKNSSKNKELVWLIGAILLNLADFLGNYFELWTNTQESRLLLGSFFGFSIPLILVNEFFKQNK